VHARHTLGSGVAAALGDLGKCMQVVEVDIPGFCRVHDINPL
jgi:hypothetical protein